MAEGKSRPSLPINKPENRDAPLRHAHSQGSIDRVGQKKKLKKEITPIPEAEEEDSDNNVKRKDNRKMSNVSRTSRAPSIGKRDEHRSSKISRSGKLSRTPSAAGSTASYVNGGFEVDPEDLSRGTSARSSMNHSIVTVKEQYCFCSKWSTCQKASAVTISVLVIIIIVLIVVIIVISQNPDISNTVRGFVQFR